MHSVVDFRVILTVVIAALLFVTASRYVLMTLCYQVLCLEVDCRRNCALFTVTQTTRKNLVLHLVRLNCISDSGNRSASASKLCDQGILARFPA